MYWVFIAALGFSLGVASKGCSLVVPGFALLWLLLLQFSGSRVHGLSGCSWQAYLPCRMRDLPGPGVKLMSPALAGRFPTIEQPRDVPRIILMEEI